MKYYLVALFDQDSYSYIESLQKGFCKKYKLYKNAPMLHIPLEVVSNAPDAEKLWAIIEGLLKPYKKFKVEINGSLSFDSSTKSVNLRIENKGYISKLARNINDLLRLHGFSVKEEAEPIELHIPFANSNHPLKEWSSNDCIASCTSNRSETLCTMFRVNSLELWKSNTNKKEPIIKSLSLREY